jgi:hypothetical protein
LCLFPPFCVQVMPYLNSPLVEATKIGFKTAEQCNSVCKLWCRGSVSGSKFTDLDFVTGPASLYANGRAPHATSTMTEVDGWLRATEIWENPALIIDGAIGADVVQV